MAVVWNIGMRDAKEESPTVKSSMLETMDKILEDKGLHWIKGIAAYLKSSCLPSTVIGEGQGACS